MTIYSTGGRRVDGGPGKLHEDFGLYPERVEEPLEGCFVSVVCFFCWRV